MIGVGWIRRVWYLLNRRRMERELEAEMAAHREMMGVRGAAQFGRTLLLRERARDQWGWNWLDDLGRDVRLASRSLLRTPVFAVSSVLILSLGIGLNLAFFQIVNVTMLRPPPVKDPFTLVRFYTRSERGTSSNVPFVAAQFVRRHNSVLSAVLTELESDVAWGADAGDRVKASFVSANWFDELGYGAARGRILSEEIDERPDAPPVVVVSQRLWQTRLASDPAAIGMTVRINDRPVTICGVARADFPGLRVDRAKDVWMPVRQLGYFQPGGQAGGVMMYGRLRPGVSPDAARDTLRASTLKALAAAHPQHFQPDHWLEPNTATMNFAPARQRREIATALALVMSLTGVVLLVVAANLASLTFCRALGRVRELSVRASLGATPMRVVRHLAAESFVLSLAGAGGGMALGWLASQQAAAALGLPPFLDFSPDWRMTAAALLFALMAVLAAGMVPALRVSRQDLARSIRDGGQQATGSLSRARLRGALVGAQVAGSVLLLALAAMMARGLHRMMHADPGFSFEEVAVLDPAPWRYGIRGAGANAYWTAVRERLRGLPQVAELALVSNAPLGNELNESDYRDAPGMSVTSMQVEPEFFHLMRVPLLAGRNFQQGDDPRDTVIVSRRLAEAMYGSLNVLGQPFPKSGPTEKRTIVGIAADAQMLKLGVPNMAELYEPLGHDSAGFKLLVRAKTDAAGLLGPLRETARAIDNRVLAEARMMRADYARKLHIPRVVGMIGVTTALLTLGLAALGMFGVISQGAAMRRKEIGIRLALGASPPGIARIVSRQVVWPLGIGLVSGVLAVAPLSKALGAILPFGFVRDWTAPLFAAAMLTGAAVTAAALPTLRALRTDPLAALRHE